MTPKVGETAFEIWEAAQDTFSNQEIHSPYSKSKVSYMIFDKVNLNLKSLPETIGHSQYFYVDGKRILETNRIYKFFRGLNHKIDEVRGRILGFKKNKFLKKEECGRRSTTTLGSGLGRG